MHYSWKTRLQKSMCQVNVKLIVANIIILQYEIAFQNHVKQMTVLRMMVFHYLRFLKRTASWLLLHECLETHKN
jgi:hypothetical protein